MTEQELIIRLKSGSQRAFDEIYALYSRRPMAFAMRYAHSAADAEDIVQDAFVNLREHQETIRSRESLSSLLFTMVRNRPVSAFRRTVNSPESENYVDYCDRLASQSASSTPIEYEEFRSTVKPAIMALPQTRRKVIAMSRFGEQSHKEIATQLKLSEQTVRNRLSLGLKTLRDKLPTAMLTLLTFLLLE